MKTLSQKISIMEAALKGEQIQEYNYEHEKWYDIEDMCDWNWEDYDYRIKPEEPKSEYIPYESAEEFLQGQKEHGMYIASDVCDNAYMLPNYTDNKGIYFDGRITYPSLITYKELSRMKWQDGTPCGKLKQ